MKPEVHKGTKSPPPSNAGNTFSLGFLRVAVIRNNNYGSRTVVEHIKDRSVVWSVYLIVYLSCFLDLGCYYSY